MGLLGEIYSFGNRTRNKLRGLLDDPKGYLQQTADQTANTLRDMTGANETAQQFALRDKINAGDKNALAQYRNLEKTIQNKLFDVALNFNPAAVGMTAWHGSPHKFDKFDIAKIGTGEGAQAYGHGAYLAENLNTAKAYQSATAAKDSVKITPKFSQEFWDRFDVPPADIRSTAQQMIQQEAFSPGYIKQLADDDSYMGIVAKNILNGGIERPTGHLYKTDIPDEAVARFLDWDKPLSQQPKNVQDFFAANGFDLGNAMTSEQLHSAAKKYLGSKQAIKMANEDIYFARDLSAARKAWNKGAADLEDYMSTGDGSWLRGVLTGAKDGNKSGGAAYRQLADKLGGFGQANYQGGGQVAASDALRTGGASLLGMSDGLRGFPSGGTESTIAQIPGIRYLDGGSRSAGQGSSNFVIFDPNMIRILERNGEATGAQPWKPGEWGGLLK